MLEERMTSSIMNANKTLLRIAGLAGLMLICSSATAGETKTATIRPDQPNPDPTPFEDVQPMDTVRFNVSIVTPSGYTFSHTGWDKSESNPLFLWARVDPKDDTSSYLVNTAWQTGTATVRTYGYWSKNEGGGSGSGGLIERWATGVANAGPALGPDLVVKVSPQAAGVGNDVSARVFGKRVSDGQEVAVKANWSVASGYFTSENQNDQHSVTFSRESAGLAYVTAVNDGPPQRSGWASAMFVEVLSISAEPDVVCVGTRPAFTVVTNPEGEQYHDLVNIEFDENTPGVQDEVVGTCGDSSTDPIAVTVVKVELQQTDSNEPLAPINRMCSNAQEKYKTVQYQINITPAKDHDDNDLTVAATVSGTAGVKFDDGTTEKTGLLNGTVVTLKTPDDATGTWNLTAECEQVGCSASDVSEEVFKFIKDASVYENRVISESSEVPPNAILIDNSADDYYDFETKSHISGHEAMITTRVNGKFGVKTSPARLYSGDVNATLKVSLMATLWADDGCVSYMYFKVADRDGNTWKLFSSEGGTKEGSASFVSDDLDWKINPTPAPPDKPWLGDSAHSCAQSDLLSWHSSGVRIERLDVEIKDFEIPNP